MFAVAIGIKFIMFPSLLTASILNKTTAILRGRRISLIFAMVFKPLFAHFIHKNINGIVIIIPGVFVRKNEVANILTIVILTKIINEKKSRYMVFSIILFFSFNIYFLFSLKLYLLKIYINITPNKVPNNIDIHESLPVNLKMREFPDAIKKLFDRK